MTESIRAVALRADDSTAEPLGLRFDRESDLLVVDAEPTVDEALARIDDGDVACVLVDAALVRAEDSAVVERVRAIDPDVPIVVVTEDEADTPYDALEAGATDFVCPSGDRTPAAVQATRIEDAAIRYRAQTGAGGVGDDRPDGLSGASEVQGHVRRDEYERLFEESSQSIFVTDADGEFTYVNPAGAKVTGYSAAAMVEGGPEMLYDEDELQTFYAAIEDLVAGGDREVTTVEATLETKAGRRVPVEATMTLRTDEDGDFRGVVGVVRDVTEERKTERRLRENESIMRAIPDEIVVIDTEGYLSRVVPAIGSETTSTGYTLEELDGMHVSKVMDEESLERASDLIAEMVTSDRERATIELEILRRDGERLWRESHFTLLEDDAGKTLGTVGVLRDIEERKAYEQELERQNERLEQFASITSHDLRNPLNVAQGYLDLVVEECDTEHTATIEDALERMEQLIEDTLTWARQGGTVDEREPIDLASLVPECWEAVATQAGTARALDDVTVDGDPDRVRRLLENLMRNAVEHGGEDVTVRIGRLTDDGFYVEDDGPGIPPDDRESVFDAGVTTAADGTGFGLAIVAEIVEAHGWEIDVGESESGGARFEITGVDRPA